jgi:hypothetical protein
MKANRVPGNVSVTLIGRNPMSDKQVAIRPVFAATQAHRWRVVFRQHTTFPDGNTERRIPGFPLNPAAASCSTRRTRRPVVPIWHRPFHFRKLFSARVRNRVLNVRPDSTVERMPWPDSS